MANTTWNASDKSANIALTGSNLIARQSASGANGGARGAHYQNANKFYWECTFNTITNTSSGIGIGTLSTVLNASFGPSATTSIGMIRTGRIYVLGSIQTPNFSTIASGAIIGIALDFTAGKLWMRLAPSGQWNMSGTADPATSVGGISISTSINYYPYTCLGALNDQVTANFGDSAFSGTVPSGFISGFPTVVALPAATTGLQNAVTVIT